MGRSYFLIIIALLSTLAVRAQRTEPLNGNPVEMANKTVSELAVLININAAIQDSIKNTFTVFFEKMKNGISSESQVDIRFLENTRDSKVKTFLSTEQYTIYQVFIEEKKLRRIGVNGEIMPDRP
ncbi:MAG: hypothetical protein WCX31_19130 [Salinivirgaceae bacterium]|jgi:hypothetical protein